LAGSRPEGFGFLGGPARVAGQGVASVRTEGAHGSQSLGSRGPSRRLGVPSPRGWPMCGAVCGGPAHVAGRSVRLRSEPKRRTDRSPSDPVALRRCWSASPAVSRGTSRGGCPCGGCPRSRPGYTNSFMAGWPGIWHLTRQPPQGAMPKKAILAQSHTVILPKQATGFKSQYPQVVSKMAQLA